jgi:hypothetical protein
MEKLSSEIEETSCYRQGMKLIPTSSALEVDYVLHERVKTYRHETFPLVWEIELSNGGDGLSDL